MKQHKTPGLIRGKREFKNGPVTIETPDGKKTTYRIEKGKRTKLMPTAKLTSLVPPRKPKQR